ncbi:MAG TPA: GNAT family N-acetyltransferase [Burkholderiales bacterium]|nr:GNAT family N-acetyltransferase [Burkholderiales bacterium]
MPPQFTVRIMNWRDALPLARPVREKVFIEEQNVPRELEWDEWDERCDHALACDSAGNPIGTARLLPDGRIGRMAVSKEWRRKGVGSALLAALLDRARGRGTTRSLLHAQTQAAGFYRRFGFSERGEEFLEAGIPHVEMTLDLVPRTGSAGS